MRRLCIILMCFFMLTACAGLAPKAPPPVDQQPQATSRAGWGGPLVMVEEEDGSPSVAAYKIKVTNTTLTDNADGTASVATSSGDVEAVLDCASDDCDEIPDAPAPLTANSTTPTLTGGHNYITQNSASTVYSDFLGKDTDGFPICVLVNDANSGFDFTSSGLRGNDKDFTAVDGETYCFIFSTDDDTWRYKGVPNSFGATISGFTASRALETDASGNLEASAVTDAELARLDGVNSLNDITTASKSAAYTIGTDSAQECYGGVIYVTSAAVMTACDALTAKMSFSVITIGAIAVSVDVQADDKMVLDGTTLDDGDKATNTSTTGDLIVCTYYSADGWYCASGSNDGDLWTDGS